MGAVFIFLLFYFYGTYIPHIEHGCARYIDAFYPEVQSLRASTVPGELKDLSIEEIIQSIHEFYLVTMGDTTVGCFRLFRPISNPHILELGSVVSRERGVGSQIATYSEQLSRNTGQTIIAITGKSYGKTLLQHGWKDATIEFPERMKESHLDKVCWKYPNS